MAVRSTRREPVVHMDDAPREDAKGKRVTRSAIWRFSSPFRRRADMAETDGKAQIEAELASLRAKESALKAAGKTRELKALAKRKGELKLMKKKGISPVITPALLGMLPSLSSGMPWPASMPAPPVPKWVSEFPHFTPPTEDDAAKFAGRLLQLGLHSRRQGRQGGMAGWRGAERVRSALCAGTMSFGSLAGFCSGYALKGIGRAGAFTVGCLFMGLTGLQAPRHHPTHTLHIPTHTLHAFAHTLHTACTRMHPSACVCTFCTCVHFLCTPMRSPSTFASNHIGLQAAGALPLCASAPFCTFAPLHRCTIHTATAPPLHHLCTSMHLYAPLCKACTPHRLQPPRPYRAYQKAHQHNLLIA